MEPDTGFDVRIESGGGAHQPAVLFLSGELDSQAAAHLADCLDRVDPTTRRMVLDMSDVSFIDSSGLRTLIQARQMFPDDADALTLRNPQASTTRLLELTGLSDYFSIS